MRDQVAPVGALGRRERRGDDLEVDGAVGVGENEQLIAAVGDANTARLPRAPRPGAASRRDRSRSISRCSEVSWSPPAMTQKRPAGALMQMGEPAGVLFLVDQRVVGLRRAEPVPPHLHRPVIVVELDIEEAVAIRAPDDAAVGLLDEVVAGRAAVPVAHANGKIFRARGVGAPRLQPVVRRMPRAAELEVVRGSWPARRHRARSGRRRRRAACGRTCSCCPPSRNFRR